MIGFRGSFGGHDLFVGIGFFAGLPHRPNPRPELGSEREATGCRQALQPASSLEQRDTRFPGAHPTRPRLIIAPMTSIVVEVVVPQGVMPGQGFLVPGPAGALHVTVPAYTGANVQFFDCTRFLATV
eukprot:1965455-Prymnesium_polylepis.1